MYRKSQQDVSTIFNIFFPSFIIVFNCSLNYEEFRTNYAIAIYWWKSAENWLNKDERYYLDQPRFFRNFCFSTTVLLKEDVHKIKWFMNNKSLMRWLFDIRQVFLLRLLRTPEMKGDSSWTVLVGEHSPLEINLVNR